MAQFRVNVQTKDGAHKWQADFPTREEAEAWLARKRPHMATYGELESAVSDRTAAHEAEKAAQAARKERRKELKRLAKKGITDAEVRTTLELLLKEFTDTD